MHKFSDHHGRTWPVRLDAAGVRRVQELTGVDVRGLTLEALGVLVGDPDRLTGVLYAVCRPAADRRGVKEGDFGRAVAGMPSVEGAFAFTLEAAELAPDPMVRLALRRVVREHRKGA